MTHFASHITEITMPSNNQPATAPAPTQEAGDVCQVFYVDQERVQAVAAAMPEEGAIQAATALLKLLGDPTRARILLALSQAELCVCDLATLLGMSLSAVSHQLRLLRAHGLVTFRKQGRLVYYSLAHPQAAQLLEEALAVAD